MPSSGAKRLKAQKGFTFTFLIQFYCIKCFWKELMTNYVVFGGLVVRLLASGTPKFEGSNLAEAVGFFGAKKILSMPSFGGEVKPSVPCHNFAACKRTQHLRGSRIVWLNLTGHFSPIIPPFANRGLSRRLVWSASGDERGN
jgi:hypothetical protein